MDGLKFTLDTSQRAEQHWLSPLSCLYLVLLVEDIVEEILEAYIGKYF